MEHLSSHHLLDPDRIPRHIAIIMDGNGRWARKRGLPRVAGHRQGTHAVRRVVEACTEFGIPILTLYTFSAENWSRPPDEVSALMFLIEQIVRRDVSELHSRGARIRVIGHLDGLPDSLRAELDRDVALTAGNTALQLNLAINYGGRREIVDAARALAERARAGVLAPEDITEERFAQELYAPDIPDPDLLIRTGGNLRVSNFLLWQIAYSELWVTRTYWPDFTREHLLDALLDYQSRERRYGNLVTRR